MSFGDPVLIEGYQCEYEYFDEDVRDREACTSFELHLRDHKGLAKNLVLLPSFPTRPPFRRRPGSSASDVSLGVGEEQSAL